jgi:hypothetical protein
MAPMPEHVGIYSVMQNARVFIYNRMYVFRPQFDAVFRDFFHIIGCGM